MDLRALIAVREALEARKDAEAAALARLRGDRDALAARRAALLEQAAGPAHGGADFAALQADARWRATSRARAADLAREIAALDARIDAAAEALSEAFAEARGVEKVIDATRRLMNKRREPR